MSRRLGSFDAHRHLVGDADTVAFERDHFFRMIREDANVGETEIDQDLCADAAFMLHHALTRGFAIKLPTAMKVNLWQCSRRVSRFDAEAASGVVEIEKYTAAFL